MRAVLDTNVIVAAFRSPTGVSARLLSAVTDRRLTLVCNPPLFLEYEQVLKRPEHLDAAGLTTLQIDAALGGLAALLEPAAPGPSLRPQLHDPDDEMVLDAAIFGRADLIATFEVSTFRLAGERFRIAIMTPAEVWAKLNP